MKLPSPIFLAVFFMSALIFLSHAVHAQGSSGKAISSDYNLENVIISPRDFGDTTVGEIILHMKKNMKDSTGKAVKTVNFSAVKSGNYNPASYPVKQFCIEQDLPILTILERLENNIGIHPKIENNTVILPFEKLLMPTKRMHLSLEANAALLWKNKYHFKQPNEKGEIDIQALLEKNGITFPPGSYAKYKPEFNLLTLCNTVAAWEQLQNLVTKEEGENIIFSDQVIASMFDEEESVSTKKNSSDETETLVTPYRFFNGILLASGGIHRLIHKNTNATFLENTIKYPSKTSIIRLQFEKLHITFSDIIYNNEKTTITAPQESMRIAKIYFNSMHDDYSPVERVCAKVTASPEYSPSLLKAVYTPFTKELKKTNTLEEAIHLFQENLTQTNTIGTDTSQVRLISNIPEDELKKAINHEASPSGSFIKLLDKFCEKADLFFTFRDSSIILESRKDSRIEKRNYTVSSEIIEHIIRDARDEISKGKKINPPYSPKEIVAGLEKMNKKYEKYKLAFSSGTMCEYDTKTSILTVSHTALGHYILKQHLDEIIEHFKNKQKISYAIYRINEKKLIQLQEELNKRTKNKKLIYRDLPKNTDSFLKLVASIFNKKPSDYGEYKIIYQKNLLYVHGNGDLQDNIFQVAVAAAAQPQK